MKGLVKIIKVEAGESKRVFDIEVENVHAFTAKNPKSGLESISHNSARMSTKNWRDKSVLEFITVKRPIEYDKKSAEEIVELRKIKSSFGFLWSSNNSIMVDEDFWKLISLKRKDDNYNDDLTKHARKVFKLSTEASYGDGTGEPGFINQDKLVKNDEGLEILFAGDYVGSKKYKLRDETNLLLGRLAKRAKKKKNYMIVNPCSEINLNLLGSFCVIGDVVPFFSKTLEDAEEAFKAVTRALIRVNTMDSIYSKEVTRTNRIGVGITGIHEFAWKQFGYSFYDLIDEKKSRNFWLTIARFSKAVFEEAVKYSKENNVVVPHTMRTIKPSGTISKLFGLTEGVHLPSMAWYMRWVQFSENDPLVKKYKENGYAFKELKQYKNTTIIGFPTCPVISELGLGDKLVTASQASMEDQYKWLMLLEKYWIIGTDEEGNELKKDVGSQISYTCKYDPNKITYQEFYDTLLKYQSKVKCCSVMPMSDASAYEYQPEQAVTKAEYEDFCRNIKNTLEEDISKAHIECEGGACPIDFREDKNNI